jgi:hypothetical protein
LTALWDKLQDALETREDRLYAAIHHVLQALDAAWLHEQIRARADKLRKNRRFPESARWLTLLRDTPAWDDDARYAFAVAALKSHTKRSLAATVRRADAAVETFRALGSSPFPLAERLRRERVVEPEELYFVAFNLAEERDSRPLARELLEHLGSKYGRTKVGRAARNKLQLVAG